MGIDLFDGSGHPITLDNVDRQLSADPPDINMLPEYDHDPRTVDNLMDGINHTCDDLHAWLAPFTPGSNHLIFMNLNNETTISMIRIWNYNKSRIHSHRGARYVEILLDNQIIFKGEVKRAVGEVLLLDEDEVSEERIRRVPRRGGGNNIFSGLTTSAKHRVSTHAQSASCLQ